jgi:hypothetical protein
MATYYICIYSDIMAEDEEGKEYRWETGYERTWYVES